MGTSTDFRPLFTRATLFALAVGMSGPFLTLYALELGADSVDLGLLQAALNTVPNVLQLPFGRLTDRLGRKKLILYCGSLIYFSVFIPILFVFTPKQYVLLLSIQSASNALMTPAWLSLVGDATTIDNRGSAMAKLNLLNGVGSLTATLFTSFFVYLYFGASKAGYQFMFLASLVFGIFATISTYFIKEPQRRSIKESVEPFKDIFKAFRKNLLFSQFVTLSTIYGFFMSISWPLMGLTQAKVLGGGPLEFGILQISNMSAYIISQTVFRHIFDRAGRVPVLALAKFGLISFPLIYAFAPNMTYLYIANFIVGVFSALNDTAVLSYLFDSTPSGQRGSYTSLYNLSVGLSYFLGSLVGGVLVSAGIPIFGFTASLQFVYLISAVGRGSIALMHKKLIETRKSETSLKAALMEELHLKSKNPKE